MTLSKDSKLSANVHREYFTLYFDVCYPSAASPIAEKLTLVLFFFTS